MSANKAILDALWDKLVEDFSDDGPHNAFLKHCQQADLLDEAARRYREYKDALPDEDPQRDKCDKRLAAIAMVAMATLEAMKQEPAKRGMAIKIITFFVVVLTLAAVVGLIRALTI